MIDTRTYLARIGSTKDDLSADLDTLRYLQRAHLLAVPFENLDIHWSRPIVLDVEKFYQKIVGLRRGGFCYELNGLFNELLRSIGFQTRLISARVFGGTTHGPEFDHAAIIARLDDAEFLTDVGFGAFSTEPLRMLFDEEQQDPSGTFTIRKREDGYIEVMKREDGIWRSEYMFRDVAHELDDFAEMCDFQQYSPDSHFTKGKLCSIMTVSGRKTLTDKNFIVTDQSGRSETPVGSEKEFYEILEREFQISR